MLYQPSFRLPLRAGAATASVGAAVLLTLLSSAPAFAQGFTTADTQIRFDGVSLSPLQATARAGNTSAPSPGGGIVPIFVYQLPTLAAGTTITSAVLSLNLVSLTTPGGINYNVDLYGLGFRTTAAPTAADFYTGPLDTSGNAVLLQDNFVLRSSAVPARYASTVAGSSAIASFLNAQYAKGAVGGASGNFVFFRLSPDVTFGSVTAGGGYDFNTQDNVSTSGLRPTLTLTTAAVGASAPEPGSVLLMAAGLLPLAGIAIRRRIAR